MLKLSLRTFVLAITVSFSILTIIVWLVVEYSYLFILLLIPLVPVLWYFGIWLAKLDAEGCR